MEINIFWTGGWDSTFRICTLVADSNCKIQPFYIIDPERKSYPLEINTMYKIKHIINMKNGSEIIRPVKFYHIDDIFPNEQITNWYNILKQKLKLGSQYHLMPRFLEQNGITDMELSIEKGRIYEYIKDYLDLKNDYNGNYHVLNDQYIDTELGIFRNYRFPIITIQKNDTIKIARDKGFLDILNMTWFCFNPVKGDKPCGLCNPCIELIKKGMGHRLPGLSYYKSKNAKLIKKTRGIVNKLSEILKYNKILL